MQRVLSTYGCSRTWCRKAHRTLLLILLLASITYVLVTTAQLKSHDYIEISLIMACSCVAEAGVCILDLLSPRLTSGRRKHCFWLLALTCLLFYSTTQSKTTHNNKSVVLIFTTAMIPVWIGLYCKALFDEQFLSVYDRCDYNLGIISGELGSNGILHHNNNNNNNNNNNQIPNNDLHTLDSPNKTSNHLNPFIQPSKQRASALLTLTFVTRFVLTMLNYIGLNTSDMTYLENAHASFIFSITSARENEAQRRRHQDQSSPSLPFLPSSSATNAIRSNSDSSPNLISIVPTPTSTSNASLQSLSNNKLKSIRSNYKNTNADVHIAEMSEVCIKFLAQIMSIFVTKLKSHSNIQLLPTGNIISSDERIQIPLIQGLSQLFQSGEKKTMVDRVEKILLPLPSPLEPTNGVFHFCMSSVLVMFSTRYFLTPFSISIVGKKGTKISKWLRSTLLMYMVLRLGIIKTKALYMENKKEDNNRGLMITTPRKSPRIV